MIALIQRVSQARVAVSAQVIGKIQHGLLALIAVERADTPANARRLCERLLGYRVFADEHGRMNLSVREVDGGLLLVPQFTLAADTRRGLRPSFAAAADPAKGAELFALLIKEAQTHYLHVATGQFGATMQVHLINDGPVTLWLQG